MPSLDEVFAVAERANIPAEVWHLKTAYKANWGRMAEVLKHFDDARARGLDVTANMYPYDRASNGLDACLPLWVREGGLDQMLQPPQGSGAARSHQARHGRCQRQGLGEPVVRLRRRRRRDGLDRARSRAAQMGRQEPGRDRQGDGQGSARCGDGSRDRRSRRDVGDHLDHARRRCAAGAGEPDDVDRHRFRARARRTGRSPNRSRIRARGDRSRACSASTSATKS